MKITRVETLQSPTFPNLLWLQIHTDDGLIGLCQALRPDFLTRPDVVVRA